MMDNFFVLGSSSHVDSFIQIPKALFSDGRFTKLPIRCKVAYSIYLSRYAATTYKDNEGPYIIFSDKEMAQMIDTTAAYVKTVRRKLRDVGLIGYRRSVSYNRIYLYSYSKREGGDNAFFYENTLDTWRFYRFPRKLLEEKFINLDLNSKFIYSMYFDMMCLSQTNFFSDSHERIYFQQSADEQVIRSGFSKPTLKKSRDMLKACHLLNEYRPFGQPIRYYLMKLDQFEDNVFAFENMTAEEKAAYIKSRDHEFAEFISTRPETPDYRKLLKEKKITVAGAADIYMSQTGKSLSVGGLRKYLNGTRRMPEDVRNVLNGIISGDPAICKKSAEENENKKTTYIQEKGPSFSRKKDMENVANVTGITYNNKLEQNNNTDINKTETKKNKNNNKIRENLYLVAKKSGFKFTDKDLEFIKSVSPYIDTDFSENSVTATIIALNSMSTRFFNSPNAQINYFVKVYKDRIKNNYSWYRTSAENEKEIYMSRNYPDVHTEIPDEIKNYKWW